MLPSFRRGMHFNTEFTHLRQPLVLRQAHSTSGCTVSPSRASEPSEGNRARGHPVATETGHGCCSAVRNTPGMGTWQLTVSHNDSQVWFWSSELVLEYRVGHRPDPNGEFDAVPLAAATLSRNTTPQVPRHFVLLAPCHRRATHGDLQPASASRHTGNHIAPQHKHPLATGWYLAGCFHHPCETPR